MPLISSKKGFLILKQNNVITPLTEDTKDKFNKLWLYPASGNIGGIIQVNTQSIYVGLRGPGGDVTPDLINAGDLPLKIELPDGQTMHLNEVIAQGTTGDGIFFCYS
jgi:hypothetical protein